MGPVHDRKPWRPFLWTVAGLFAAVPAYVAAGVALSVAAGASLFGDPTAEPDAWWYSYASYAYLMAGGVSTVAAFVLSRKRLGYALLPFAPTLVLISALAVLGDGI